MTAINFPTLSRRNMTSFEFYLATNTQSFTSPLNGSVQTLELPGARWVCTMSLKNQNEADGRIIKGLIAALNGMAGRINLWDMSHSLPSGIATGTPLVKGAAQTGKSLLTDGWTASVTGILKAGDMFSVNSELKIVTADVNSNSGGEATIPFAPVLRASPADNAAIGISSPTCVMRLIDDQQMKMAMTEGRLFNPVLSFVEVF